MAEKLTKISGYKCCTRCHTITANAKSGFETGKNHSDLIPPNIKIKNPRSVFSMASSNKNGSSNRLVVPEAQEAMNRFKMEAANEVGVNLKEGYNGELTSREAGSIGGQMVKKMIEAYENSIK